jgi:pilus assembly protein CpaB
MKWAIVSLVILGVLAAAGVAVLVASLPHLTGAGQVADTGEPQEMSILVAAEDLSARSILRAESVTVNSVPVSEAPKDFFGRPEQVIGKVLATSVLKGQLLRQSHFATEGSSAELAAAMTGESRAVTLSLEDYAGLRGLLYPGSLVDILAAFDAPGREGEPVSTTLLQGIQVLKVDGASLYGKEDSDDGGVVGRASSRRMLVVVQVTPEQAQTLLLAQENGTVSLALRKPTDIAATDLDPVWLSQLIGGSALDVATQAMPPEPAPASPVLPATVPVAPAPSPPTPAEPGEPDELQTWQTTVIRGAFEEVLVFPIDRAALGDGEPSNTDNAP